MACFHGFELRPMSASVRRKSVRHPPTTAECDVSQSPNQATVAPQPFKDTGPAVLPNNWLNSHRPSRGVRQSTGPNCLPVVPNRNWFKPSGQTSGKKRAATNSHSAPNGCAFAPGVAGSFFIQVQP
jgi:hypothetical protein